MDSESELAAGNLEPQFGASSWNLNLEPSQGAFIWNLKLDLSLEASFGTFNCKVDMEPQFELELGLGACGWLV